MLGLVVQSASVFAADQAAELGADAGPEAVVKYTSDTLLASLEENKEAIAADKGLVYRLVEEIVLPRFDFESMSRLALGKHWRRATADQRTEFVNEFRTLLVNTYTIALTEYSGETVKFLPMRANPDDRRVTVKTEINQPGGQPISMFYKLLNKGKGWQVYDVVVEGVSLVTSYRSEFNQDMRQGGVDTVIANLKKRNKKHVEEQSGTEHVDKSAEPVAATDAQQGA